MLTKASETPVLLAASSKVGTRAQATAAKAGEIVLLLVRAGPMLRNDALLCAAARRATAAAVGTAIHEAVFKAADAASDACARATALWHVGYLLDVAALSPDAAKRYADALMQSGALEEAAAALLAKPCESRTAALARVHCMVGSWCRDRWRWVQACVASRAHVVMAAGAARPASMRALAMMAGMLATHVELQSPASSSCFVQDVVDSGVRTAVQAALAAAPTSELAALPLRLTMHLLRLSKHAGRGCEPTAASLVSAVLPGAVRAILWTTTLSLPLGSTASRLRREAALVVAMSLTAAPAAVVTAVPSASLDDALMAVFTCQQDGNARWAAALSVGVLLAADTSIAGLPLPKLLGAPGRAAAVQVLLQWPPQVCRPSVHACCKLISSGGVGGLGGLGTLGMGDADLRRALTESLIKHEILTEHAPSSSTEPAPEQAAQILLRTLCPDWCGEVVRVLMGGGAWLKQVPPGSLPPHAGCCVCMSKDGGWAQLPCRHVIHARCFVKWAATGHSTCPLCRFCVIERVAMPTHIKSDVMVQVSTTRAFGGRAGCSGGSG